MEIPACIFLSSRMASKAPLRASIIGAIAFIFLSGSFPASGQNSQNITPITGFHAISDSDPFAKKDILAVVSNAAKVVNINGAQATVTIGCSEPNALVALFSSITDDPAFPTLGVKVDLTGANLDIETHLGNSAPNGPGGYQSVRLRLRFDEENTFEPATSSITVHHVEFAYPSLDHVQRTHRLLIGLPSGGQSANLQINLDDVPLKNLLQVA